MFFHYEVIANGPLKIEKRKELIIEFYGKFFTKGNADNKKRDPLGLFFYYQYGYNYFLPNTAPITPPARPIITVATKGSTSAPVRFIVLLVPYMVRSYA